MKSKIIKAVGKEIVSLLFIIYRQGLSITPMERIEDLIF